MSEKFDSNTGWQMNQEGDVVPDDAQTDFIDYKQKHINDHDLRVIHPEFDKQSEVLNNTSILNNQNPIGGTKKIELPNQGASNWSNGSAKKDDEIKKRSGPLTGQQRAEGIKRVKELRAQLNNQQKPSNPADIPNPQTPDTLF